MSSFLFQYGPGEATNVLVIDRISVRRLRSVRDACASTHWGVSSPRSVGRARRSSRCIADLCRHCEHPHGMRDCPPNAIHRMPNGGRVHRQRYLDRMRGTAKTTALPTA